MIEIVWPKHDAPFPLAQQRQDAINVRLVRTAGNDNVSINEAILFLKFFSLNKCLRVSDSLLAAIPEKLLKEAPEFSAKKIYCAPSTFSWWAAHSLDENSEIIIPNLFKEKLGIYIKSKKVTII